MTLHISALAAGSAYQVSDRLASKGMSPWDRQWNKTVVLRSMEALVSIGFSGPAFVGRVPIDEWATAALWGSPIPDDPLFTIQVGAAIPRLGLSGYLRRLEVGVSETVKARQLPRRNLVGASVIGWRISGHRVRPCALSLQWDGRGRARFCRQTRRVQRFTGVSAHPGDWVTAGRLRQLRDSLTRPQSFDERENLMIQLLREVAASGAPVGPDAMCVRIPNDRAVPRIRFAPLNLPMQTFIGEDDSPHVVPVAYTPAFVTPTVAQLPAVCTGRRSRTSTGSSWSGSFHQCPHRGLANDSYG